MRLRQQAQAGPVAALAGILIVTAWSMVDRKQLLFHLRATRFDAGMKKVT